MKFFLIAALLLCSAWAQSPEDLTPPASSVSMAPAPVLTAAQGKPATVTLSFRVARGYHINSNQPKSEFLIPTALRMNATTDFVIGKTTYPAGQDVSFAFDPSEKLNVYTGEFNVDVLVHPLMSVQPGKYAMHGILKYQACDNSACYPPKQLPVSFDVKVAKAASAARANPAQSPHAH